MRAIPNPERVKTWDSVRPAIEQLDDLMRRYEARRNEQGNRETLSEDIKCTSLELLVPADIERHLILNKSRLTTYQDMRSSSRRLLERRAKSTDPGPIRHRVRDKALSKVLNSLVKGGSKGGKGKGNDKGGGKGKGKRCPCIKRKEFTNFYLESNSGFGRQSKGT